MAIMLAACGGGGSSNTNGTNAGGNTNTTGTNPSATLQVTPLTINVTAPVNGSAPTAQLQASILSNAAQNFYIEGHFSHDGIDSVNGSVSGSVDNVAIDFNQPSAMGVGTFRDTVTITGCYDQACTQQVSGSPQNVAVTYNVTAAVLALNSISPKQVTAGGGPFTLTVFGTGFGATSLVSWNGANLPTTYVSGTELRAAVGASQISSVGTASIAVVNPSDQGGTSATQTLTIMAPTVDAVSYQMNPAHTGSVTFSNASLPTSSTWSVNVGGSPSYALIVGGVVYVTVSVNGASQLLALNGTTGATLWGPIAFSGQANAAYDNGHIFVVSNSGSYGGQLIEALDPATGTEQWSSAAPGIWDNAPPVALDGIVYTDNTGTIMAFDEATGTMLWQGSSGGTDGTVALTVDGVYAASPCTALALQPATGASLWHNNSGCGGGGGATPVVSNGLAYEPNGEIGPSGQVFNAETGAIEGSYSASGMPAFSATTGFFLFNSTLQGIQQSNNQILWSFAGDGSLVSAPVTVNNWVFIGSSGGNLYAVDATTGQQLWSQNLGAAIPSSNQYASDFYSGLAAGDGLLIVPNGNYLTAFTLSTSP
ncbi:MAG TPA: PQQ-binding-like beta-propeller repeat protein [Steroidobacteraceae bacterium]|nr:PQQ-binding-like beta-propeller repeat protein [Steroidobacteraceae bacterium]